jgi:hypothetical protein
MGFTMTNCYAANILTASGGTAGGVFGQSNYVNSNNAITITNSFWDTEVSVTSTSYVGGTGKTTAEMKTQSTFTGWDFATIWKIDASSNGGMPNLVRQNTPIKNISTATSASSEALTSESNLIITPSGTLLVDQETTVKNLTVEAGGKLNLANAMTISGDVNFKADDNGSFSATVGAGMAVTGNVKYVKTMTRNQWYFISFPCDVLKTDITLSDGITSLGQFGTYDNVSPVSDWDVKYYDGTTRASTGKTDGSNWKTIAGNKLEAYKGYIFWLKAGAGTLDVTFKLNNSLVASENVRTIPVLGNQVGALKSNKGWNLVGQPYLSRYAGGKAGINYMTFPDGVAAQTYTTLRSSENAGNGKIIDPFTAYFVQVDNSDDITFAINGRSSAPASVKNDASDMLQLDLTTATGTDNTNLILDNDQTTEYTIGQDMVKWLGTGTAKPQVYTRLDNLNFSYNALPLASVVNLPLGFYTLTASKTTISANATSARSLSKLLLWDNTAKIETNLLTSNYSFTADAGTNNTRFTISAQRQQFRKEIIFKQFL